MDFFDALVRLETDLWNLVDSELTKRGQVRLALLHALRLLDRLGGNGRVQDLSEGLSITIGAASKLVDRLERDGLAARRRHPSDRRSSLISLTDLGVSACREGHIVAQGVVDVILGDDPDLARLTEALERIETSVVAQHEEGTK